MPISEKDVAHVARLARIELREPELRLYREQLDAVLASMEELKGVDTEGVPPTTSVFGAKDVLRADEPMPFPEAESLLAAAPERDGPYFKVKKVIE